MTEKARFTVRESADRLTVSVGTLRRWIRKGAIKVVFVGPHRAVRIERDELEKHVRHPPAAP